MAEKLIKSVLWFTGFAGLGYGLLVFCEQSDATIASIKKDLPGIEKSPNETLKKNQQFMNVLKSAAESKKPLYRLNKEGIDQELKKQ